MITIHHLSLQVGEKKLLEDASLNLYPATFYLLNGSSGIGKSSLLKFLGCFIHGKGDYVFRGERITEDNRAYYQKQEISYVSQNSLLLEHMKVSEMLDFARQWHPSKEDSSSLIKGLAINRIMNKKIKSLSGGERQRVAFVCALLKEATLYLFDEPTSMVDKKYQLVMKEAMERLVKQGKTVVVISHQLDLFDADVLLTIEHQKIVASQHQEMNDDSGKITPPFHVSHPQNILKYFYRQHGVLMWVVLMMMGFCLNIGMDIFDYGKEKITHFNDLVERAQVHELLVMKDDHPISKTNNVYMYLPQMEKETITKVKEMDGVNQVYPYYYFTLYGDGYVQDASMMPSPLDVKKYADILLKKNEKVISRINYHEQYQEIIEIELNGKIEKIETSEIYSIFPTYPHQNYDLLCEEVSKEDGIYISQSVADLLGIKEIDGEVINLWFGVPLIPSAIHLSVEAEEHIKWESENALYVLENKDFLIKGILSSDFSAMYSVYSTTGNPEFFLPYPMMEKVQEEVYQKYKDQIVALGLSTEKWRGSALIVDVTDESAYASLVQNISLLSSHYLVKVTGTQAMFSGEQEAEQTLEKNTWLATILIFIAVGLGYWMIRSYLLKMRKNDYFYLMINGVSSTEIQAMERKEEWIDVFIVCLFYLMMRGHFHFFELLVIICLFRRKIR